MTANMASSSPVSVAKYLSEITRNESIQFLYTFFFEQLKPIFLETRSIGKHTPTNLTFELQRNKKFLCSVDIETVEQEPQPK